MIISLLKTALPSMSCSTLNPLQKENHVKTNLGNTKLESAKNTF